MGRSTRGLAEQLARALREDRADEDRTSRAVLPASARGRARVVAQAPGVLSGLAVAVRLGRSAGLTVRPRARDGDPVRRGRVVLELEGNLGRILAVERTLLNYVMHLSGVATSTRAAVRAARGRVAIFATRKTLPGLRDLEKAAVVDGGGQPNRRDLSAGLLVKSTHVRLVGLEAATAKARGAARGSEPVQVEVRTLAEAERAVAAGARRLLFDNASPDAARRLLRDLKRRGIRRSLWVELSGGITPATVGRYARVGADALSLGSLTHSAPALPFHLVVDPAGSTSASRRTRTTRRGRPPGDSR